MIQPLETITMPSEAEFVERYVAANQPVVVTGLDYDVEQWTPQAIGQTLGDLTALVYGSLFDLEDIQTLEDYLDDWFGADGAIEDDVPYVRWYNKLRDVDFAWGDEAFRRVADHWRGPACLPTDRYLVPVSSANAGVDPVTDPFPYRGVLLAARGARTRLHRDPFCTDAVVCQFHGVKEAALYSPARTKELTTGDEGSSFGGFIDVREDSRHQLSVEPDFHGYVRPGDMIYIPHGWLHDVVVVEDAISVTWNFIHASGAAAYTDYLGRRPETDSEFEILQYFHALAGLPDQTIAELTRLSTTAASTS